MSKHHDWQNKTSAIISADNLTDVYVCAKCGKEVSSFEYIRWQKTKYECQPRRVDKGKFKRIIAQAKAQNPPPMNLQEINDRWIEVREQIIKDQHEQWRKERLEMIKNGGGTWIINSG